MHINANVANCEQHYGQDIMLIGGLNLLFTVNNISMNGRAIPLMTDSSKKV